MTLHAQATIDSRPLRREDREPPQPKPGEILVRVAACGICRTDLHVIEGDLPLHRTPIVPGHQVVGRVERVGDGATRFRIGDRVGIAWLRMTCGRCAFCVSGRENLCERAEFTGWDADGGFADYTVVPEAFAYAIPTVFTDVDAAPLLCAGIIGYRALKLSGVTGHGKLGIYGFGSSAHVTLQVARARGADVYVWTRAPAQQQFARRLGAAWAGDLDAPAPERMDGAIIFAPVGDVVPVALANLARGGTLALAGIYMTPLPPLPYASLFEERAIRTVTANTRADGAELLEAAAQIPIRPTVTTFPLDQANEALQRLKAGAFAGTGVLVTGVASGI
jgi:propanol-preferring alcohol dehydrogenase